jgi:hypothetical protein
MGVGRIMDTIVSFIELNIMRYYKSKKSINLLKEIIKKDGGFLVQPSEIFMIYSLSRSQRKMNGNYAEVGVYKGSSAEAICKAKGNKHIYLFDTFNGIPAIDKIDTRFSKEMFTSNYEYVKKRLSKYKNVHIYKGLFPKTAEPIKNKKFVFVHFDVDIYQSTKNCLEFFYKRMQKGGIILSHDYSQAKGVNKAFNDFFMGKPEEIIELPMTQCMVIKK